MEEVPAAEGAKGTVIVEGGTEYDTRIHEALARIFIVARSDVIIDSATALASRLNKFIRLRAQLGKGMAPDERIIEFRKAEREFGRSYDEN
jgi:hypothetical protein